MNEKSFRPRTYAAIDIGSNAVRLLIKRMLMPLPARPEKLLLLRVPLRLGMDVFAGGAIGKSRAEDLVHLMKAYRILMRIYRVDRYRACATSAMRQAANGSEIIREIREKAKIDIEIISGADEARIVYNNHMELGGPASVSGVWLYVDVGGGSTELNLMADGRLRFSRSFDIGTVRLLKGKVKQSVRKELLSTCRELASAYPGNITIVGSGGNINKLYKMASVKDVTSRSMTVAELRCLYDALKPLSVEQRMKIYGMRSDRADVIVPAAEIFLSIASATDASLIHVPQIGVADGIIDGLIAS